MTSTLKYILALTAVTLVLTDAVLFAETTSAKSFSDDFSSETFKPEWAAGDAGWKIARGTVTWTTVPGVIDTLLKCKAVTLSPGYSISTNIRLETDDGGHWGGIAYNIQDAGNFYAFRIVCKKEAETGYYQILKFTNGTPKALKFTEVPLEMKIVYTLTVQIIGDGSVKYSIRNGGIVVLESEAPVDDLNAPYTGGLSGLYAGCVECYFSAFKVEPTASASK